METDDFWDRTAGLFVVLAYCAAILFAIAVISWQFLHWLKTGQWTPVPLLTAFQFFKIDLSSVYSPHNWFGLARVTQWILNLPLSFVGLAFLIILSHIWDYVISLGNTSLQGKR
jgi:hypothetical protein